MEISVLENDIAFTRPMLALTAISRDSYKFDMTAYIQDFYLALAQKKYDIAQNYLNIIAGASKISNDVIQTAALYSALQMASQTVDVLSSPEMKIHVSPTKVDPVVDKKEPTKVVIENNEQTIKTMPKTRIEPTDSEKEFIESKYEELLKGEGMLLLKPMSKERRVNIYRIVRSYPDMVAFSLGEGDKKPIVLRYKPRWEDKKDFREIKSAGDRAYSLKKYDECLENYFLLLQFGEPRAYVYAKIGLAYLKKWDKTRCIDYLTVATALNKEEGGTLDFTEMIAGLKGEISKDDRKAYFKMNESEFENSTPDYYGIDNIHEITDYIIETGMEVNVACKEMGLTDEQIDIVRLIYARSYYTQGNYEKGDEFMKVVERSQNKTPYVMNIFRDIQKNKKFFINRKEGEEQPIPLTIKPQGR